MLICNQLQVLKNNVASIFTIAIVDIGYNVHASSHTHNVIILSFYNKFCETPQ